MLVISLYAILSHLDWSCRTNKTALVKNMEVIVRDMGKLSQVDITPSSPLFVAACKIYKRRGEECFSHKYLPSQFSFQNLEFQFQHKI